MQREIFWQSVIYDGLLYICMLKKGLDYKTLARLHLQMLVLPELAASQMITKYTEIIDYSLMFFCYLESGT